MANTTKTDGAHAQLFTKYAERASKMGGVTTAGEIDAHPTKLELVMLHNLRLVGLVTAYRKKGLIYIKFTPAGEAMAAEQGFNVIPPKFQQGEPP